MPLTLNIKLPTGNRISLSIDSSMTVLELKQQASPLISIPGESLRLVSSSGRTLSPDNAELSIFSLVDGDTLYATRVSATTAPLPQTSNTRTFPGMEQMDNPLVR